MPSAVDILVRLRTSTANGLIDLHVALRGLQRDADAGEAALKNLRAGLIGLSPAVVPLAAGLAASVAPLIEQLGGASVAAAAFGAAIIPQFKSLSDVSKASDKATAATSKYGAASKQATTAQQQYLAALGVMPPATQKAAAALGGLKQQYQGWSNALASQTMPVAIKSFGVMEALIPRLTPLVGAASKQFDRLVTALGGMTQTKGFDRLDKEFNQFAAGSLKKLTDEILHLARVISQHDFNTGPLHDMIAYAKANAPAARDTLKHLLEALANLGKAASQAGPGMLTIVNTLAKLINALPPEVLTRLLQLYTALRLLKGTAAGVNILGGALGGLTRRLGSMTTAATNAGGGLAGVRAALGSLSTGTKVAGAVAVIAGVVLALKGLSGSGKAAPDVDKLTTALGQLGRTGRSAGEAARVVGKDFDDLNYAIGRLNGRKSGMDSFNDTMNAVFTLGLKHSNSLSSAKKTIDGIDKALADLVKNGQANLAAAALKRLADEYTKTGHPASDLTKKLKDYKSAIADAKFEQDLTTDSMGLFGKQAIETQQKLDAQKNAVQGLQQAILDLNDANRAGLDAEADYQQAVDDATKLAKDHRNALHMVNGQLDLNGQAARDAYLAMSKLASSTEANAKATLQQTGSQAKANEKLIEGHAQLVKLGEAMGLKTKDAQRFADALDNIKDPKIQVTVQEDRAKAIIADATKRLNALSKKRPTPAITANETQLKNVLRDARARLDSLDGKTAQTYIVTTYSVVNGKNENIAHEGGGYAHGGIIGAASGGPRSNMTLVGEQGPELVKLAAGSTVYSANASRQMLASASGGSSGGAYQVNLVVDGRTLARVLLDPQRELIRQLGGNVQNALGARV